MSNRGEIMTEEERLSLLKWAEKDMRDRGKLTIIGNKREHYILNEGDPTVLPIIWDIRNRIIQREGLSFYRREPILRDFLAYIPTGGYIHKHTDRNEKELIHSRFNVFIQVPENDMTTYYANKKVDTKECCYVLSRSGLDEHYTDINKTEKARVIISYGFLLPFQKLQELSFNIKLKGQYNRGNILDETERLTLKNWVLTNMMEKARAIDHNRFDYTMKKEDPDIHPLVWVIKERLFKREGIEEYLCVEGKWPRDFLGIVPNGANIPKHRDQDDPPLHQIRFNVFIQLPKEGCYTYYANIQVDAVEGSYVLCRSSVDEHWTTVNQESLERISLSFGLMLPASKIDSLTSDTTKGTYLNYPLSK